MLSRTASNLYWMARYVERAENTARILESAYRIALTQGDPLLLEQEWYAPLNITGSLYSYTGRYGKVAAQNVLRYMIFDADNASSIYSCFRVARENARAVRDCITADMWEVLNTSWLELQNVNEPELAAQGVVGFFDWVKERSCLFQGVADGTALRDHAFLFNHLGTYLERADNTARILDVKYHVLLPRVQDVGGAVDYYQWSAVLRSVSAFEPYRRIYRDTITPLRVAELLILRDDMPRSLHACMDEVNHIVQALAATTHSAEVVRVAGEIHAYLHVGRIERIFNAGLHEYVTDFIKRIHELASEINDAFFIN
jgi:uncharacterized alpha-E superfamily protein